MSIKSRKTDPLGTTQITQRGWVTAALLLSMFMTAIEMTIVATAMPRIVSDLGGFALLSWVFSAYLLTQVISIPIYGKLVDVYGRKPVFFLGLILFLIASVLCGQAQTMTQLIAFRFLQGIGGGAVQPISMTIVGDLFKPHERHKIQGLVGSVFAISSLAGPTLGALIVDLGHWSWIFYLNVPLGVFAIALLWFYFHEEKRTHQHRIDYAGAFFLAGSTGALMLGLLQGGTAWPWLGWQSIVCFLTSFVLGIVLWVCETRATEPILPLWIFKHRLISVAGAATFLNGAIMIGYSAMIPTYVQGVMGRSALSAGLTLSSMSMGWPLAAFFSGRIMAKVGYRQTAIMGALMLAAGAFGVLFLAKGSVIGIAVAIFAVGFGLGLQSNAYVVTIQSSVPWKERGVATANNMFMRTLGSSVGVAVFGGILNSVVTHRLGAFHGARGLDLINQLLSSSRKALDPAIRDPIVHALASGMMAVFIAAAIVAVICLAFTFILPSKVEARG